MRGRRGLFVHAALVVLLVTCALPFTLGSGSRPQASAAQTSPPSAPAGAATPLPSVPAVVGGTAVLPLEFAVGQMMAASFGGPSITPGLRHLIIDEKVGTVLIFADNFSDAASLMRL